MRILHLITPTSLLLLGCPDQGVTVHNADPRAEITSHADGDQPEAGRRTFTGTVEDPDHDVTELELTWLYDGAEACPPVAPDSSGNTTCDIFLDSGDHTVTLQVEDPLGGLGTAIIDLDVQPYGDPWAEISSPEAGGVYYSDQLIEFSGAIGDEADEPSVLSVTWDSSIDGELNIDGEPEADGEIIGFGYLTKGEHAVTLNVANTGGNATTASVVIDVGPPNSSPTCEILAPEDGAEGEIGEVVTFVAQVADVDVPADWLAVEWASDYDGELGSSTPESDGDVRISTSALTINTHVITMQVSDEVGATCTASVQYTVLDCPDLWYQDADGDGYGDPDVSITGCGAPSGYVDDSSDCDDGDASVNPSATEICNDTDDDCDGAIDDDDSGLDTSTASAWYADADADGYGDAASSSLACDQPSGSVADAADCDDTDAAVNPAATEVCNGGDDDCDGDIDDADSSLDATTATTWYTDSDGDGFGEAGSSSLLCEQPTGTVNDATDCDDASATTHPGADEYCDGVDNDCDGTDDEDDALDAITWYLDADADSWGTVTDSVTSCEAPTSYVQDEGDCDDGDAAVNPDAEETCNGVDDDCDGDSDEDDALDADLWYADTDLDGFGDPASSTTACEPPSGYVEDDSDCDDGDDYVYPGAFEYCDSVDNDCDGTTDGLSEITLGSNILWDANFDGCGSGVACGWGVYDRNSSGTDDPWTQEYSNWTPGSLYIERDVSDIQTSVFQDITGADTFDQYYVMEVGYVSWATTTPADVISLGTGVPDWGGTCTICTVTPNSAGTDTSEQCGPLYISATSIASCSNFAIGIETGLSGVVYLNHVQMMPCVGR